MLGRGLALREYLLNNRRNENIVADEISEAQEGLQGRCQSREWQLSFEAPSLMLTLLSCVICVTEEDISYP